MESVYPAEQAMSVILNGKGVLGSDDVDVCGASSLAILDNFRDDFVNSVMKKPFD